MGYNTTLVVRNDSLHAIRHAADFGQRVHDAVLELTRGNNVEISALGHVNAAVAIETHHSSTMVPVLVGANTGVVVDLPSLITYNTENKEVALLRFLADKHGFSISRKRSKP